MMALIWTLIVLMFLVQSSCLLSYSFSSKVTLSSEDRFEESIVSFSEFMHHCPLKCSCYNFTIDCDSSHLTHIPQNVHSSVVQLFLSNNDLQNLFYNNSLQSLILLDVSKNKLQGIDKKWMALQKGLEHLDLSYNFLGSKIIEDVFQYPVLRYLNISYNRLNVLNEKMFYHLHSLSILDLSYNEIQIIDPSTFWKQTYLQTINLSFNKLSDLHYDWFKNLQNLNILNFSNNKLKIVRNVVFAPLNQLQVLDLSHNSIKSLGLLSFKGLINLQSLNISGNNIFHFQDGVFRFLELLQVLDISYNHFTSVDNLFIYNSRITFLHMNNLSKFNFLSPSSLNGLHSLKLLDLSGSSNFSDVSIKAFSHTKSLRVLNLSFSKLSSLRKGVFDNLKYLDSIKLGGNPWKCDCYMYWILLWLSENTNTHLLSPSQTFCYSPPALEGHVLLDALDHNMVCTNASISHYTTKTKFKVGSPAHLECLVEGNPLPSLTWITPQNFLFHWFANKTNEEETLPYTTTTVPTSYVEERKRFYLMPNGSLSIQNVQRGDGGFYTCIASNPLNNDTVAIRLTLDYQYFIQIKIFSVLVGMATSFGFLLLTLIFLLIKMILKHFGVKFPCRSGNASPRTQQIRRILDSMESYKKQQLDKLRDNYNGQVQKIKDNCMQQMERLRESYSSQIERLRDIKEYGTLQIDRIRENYYFQVQRVRDYSASQIIRLRENYIFQRNRIRKFSAHHLYKLRENYKLQQQHLNKILENLNIESCRNVCQRTDSVVFEPEIAFDNILVPKICLQTFAKEICDSNDNSSQVSAYFTPEEAGSEVSGHESDDPENEDVTSTLKRSIASDIEQMIEEVTSYIPEDSPYNSSTIKETCYSKAANETIV